MNVAELFVKCLENEGVEYVFGLPGEENEDLLFALDNSSIKFVPCRHEQGASFIANVWGRLTGRAGVCLSTLGPGATNLLTGVADANLDKAPVVAITAQAGLRSLHHESHQNINIVNMYKPVTKWNTAIASPETVTEVIRKAFKVAENEKPGATHIELSDDLAKQEVEENPEPIPVRRVRRPGPDYKAIDSAVKLLKSARHPLIIAGNGAIRKLASKHLTKFSKKYDIPVASTFMGKGSISGKMDQSLLCIGIGFKDYVMKAVEQADLIIAVGYDVAEYDPRKWNGSRQKKIIHIDFLPAEVYYHYNADVEIVSDISGALWELLRRLEGEQLKFDPGWYKPVRRRILDDIKSYDLNEGDPFTIPGALNIIREIMDDDGLVITDVGSHKIWTARNFPTYTPNGCIVSNGLATMGISLPGAIAAALIDPERQVVAVMGDGCFMMNSQELETAARLGVGFTAVVFNDFDYGLISWKQKQSRGRSVYTSISNPDFKLYAESFGIKAYRPENLDDLRTQLAAAITSSELSLVEVRVDPSVNQGIIEKLDTYWREKNGDHRDKSRDR